MKQSCCRIALAVAFALVLAVAGPVRADHAVRFTHGVASGDIRPERAILWTRVDGAAHVQVEVSRDPRFRGYVRHAVAFASAEHDFTVKATVDDLEPATAYYYRFRAGRAVSETGQFRTPPRSHDAAGARFGWASDLDGTLHLNQFETLDRAREDGLDFFLWIGDNIYADAAPACGADIACMRGRYKQNRDFTALRRLMAATGSYAIWDDHEVVNDFAGQDVDPATLAAGRQAFEEYMPVREHRRDRGFYRRFRWGKDVELFILDERSFRSQEAVAACGGDLAPTLPSPFRSAIGLPPVPPAGCLDALGDPARTMLGEKQKELFKAALQRSDATWKVVVNEVAITELFGLPYDRWEGYAAERRELLDFIREEGIKNVVFVTGDLHANFIADVSQGVFTDPSTRARELLSGPVAQATLFVELVQILGSPAAADGFIGLITALIRPDCLEPDAFAYGIVEVDDATRRLSVSLKDGAGAVVCSAAFDPE